MVKKIKALVNIFFELDANKKYNFYATIFYSLFLLPLILNANFYCDDSILSTQINYFSKVYNQSFFEISANSFLGFYDSGRFYGLYFFHYIIFYFFSDRLSYQIVKAIFNFIAVLIFSWLLKLLTQNTNNSRAFIFLMPLMFLVSTFVEPLSSMGLSTQYSAIFIALASGFYILSHEKKSKKYAILAYIFFVLAFFHYEIGVCIVPIFIVLAVRFRLKKQDQEVLRIGKFKKFLNYFCVSFKVCFNELKIHLITFLFWVIFSIYLRNFVKAISYDGIVFNFDLGKIILAWIRQILASFPFGGFYKDFYWYQPEFYQIFFALILTILSYFIFVKLLPKTNLKGNYRDVVLIAVILLLVPSLETSLSSKYQNWVLAYEFNFAFVQVFLQFFGMGLLLISYVSYVIENSHKYTNKLRQKIVVQFFSIIFAISIGLINIFNYNIIYKKDIYESQNDYKIFIKAIKSGVLQDLSEYDPSSPKIPDLLLYLLDFSSIIEPDILKKSYKIKNDYMSHDKILVNIRGIFHSSALSYWQPHSLYIILFPRDKKINTDYIKNFDKFYYVDNGESDYNLLKNFKKKNLEGYVFAGKVKKIYNNCVDESDKKNCNSYIEIFAPKIFIDKDYLFNLENIIAKLNKRFGENIFIDDVAKIKNDIEKSEDGFLIKLDDRVYRVSTK